MDGEFCEKRRCEWCGGWDSNPGRPTPQDFSGESDLKSSTALRERPCPFDLNPANTATRMVSGTPASARSCHYVLLKLLREDPARSYTEMNRFMASETTLMGSGRQSTSIFLNCEGIFRVTL